MRPEGVTASLITLIGPLGVLGSRESDVTPPQCPPPSCIQLPDASNTWIPYQNVPVPGSS